MAGTMLFSNAGDGVSLYGYTAKVCIFFNLAGRLLFQIADTQLISSVLPVPYSPTLRASTNSMLKAW